MSFKTTISFILAIAGLQTACLTEKVIQERVVNKYGIPVNMGDPVNAPSPLRDAARAIVRISSEAGSTGTGFFIEQGQYFMTNEHVLGSSNCLTDGCYATLDFNYEKNGWHRRQEYFFLPRFADRNMDTAIYEVYDKRDGKRYISDYSIKVNPMSATELVGQKVHVIGHPLGHLKKWVSGEVLTTHNAGVDWFSASNLVFGGNSGSPVLNENGEWVGQVHRASIGKEEASPSGINSLVIGTASRSLLTAIEQVLFNRIDKLEPHEFYSSLERDKLSLVHIRVGKLDQYALKIEADAFQKLQVCIELVQAANHPLGVIGDRNLEESQSALNQCLEAFQYVGCEKGQLAVCPQNNTAYSLRWRTALALMKDNDYFLKQQLLSYLRLKAKLFGKAGIEENQELLEELQWEQSVFPMLSPTIATFYIQYGLSSFRAIDLYQYIHNYKSIPNYQYYVEEIVVASSFFSGVQLSDLIQKLLVDPNVSISDKLYLERILFEYRNI